MVVPEQKTTLTKLKVVFDCDLAKAGQSVWVKAELCATDQAGMVYNVKIGEETKDFILLNEAHVLLVGNDNE